MNVIAMSAGRRSLPVTLGALVLSSALCAQLQAATPANAASPLGMNLLQLSYYSAEQPFLDIFKTTGVSSATPSA